MRIERDVFRVALILAALAAATAAQPAAAQSADERNAATWYRQAFAEMDRLTNDDWMVMEVVVARPALMPTDELRRVLSKAAPAIRAAQRGARQGRSDFGIGQDPMSHRPIQDFVKARSLAKFLLVDAQVRAADGDTAGVVARAEATYGISDHLTQEGVLPGSLVSMAIVRGFADGTIEAAIQTGAIDSPTAARIAEAARIFDRPDPFGLSVAVINDHAYWVRRFEEEYNPADPNGAAKAMQSLWSSMTADPELAPSPEYLRSLTAADVRADLDRYGDAMRRAAEIFSMPDSDQSRAAMQRLIDDMQRGEYGALASIANWLERSHDSLIEVVAELRQRLELLDGIADESIDPGELVNAAFLYRRAIARLELLEEPWREAMRRVGEDPSAGLEFEPLTLTFNSARSALEDFLAATRLERCEFFANEHRRQEWFISKHAPGMRDGFRLLAVEARRQAHIAPGFPGEGAGPSEDAARTHVSPRQARGYVNTADHLAASLRMAAHLAGDRILVSSMVAHDGTLLTLRTLESAFGPDWPDHEPVRDAITEAMSRLPPGDPFGYAAAHAPAREQLSTMLRWRARDAGIGAEERFEQFVAHADAEALLYLLAVNDRLQTSDDPWRLWPDCRPLAERLPELLLPDLLDLAEIDRLVLSRHLDTGAPEAFNLDEIPRITAVEARAAAALREIAVLRKMVEGQ